MSLFALCRSDLARRIFADLGLGPPASSQTFPESKMKIMSSLSCVCNLNSNPFYVEHDIIILNIQQSSFVLFFPQKNDDESVMHSLDYGIGQNVFH